jgi:hypothetical protein
VYVQHVLKCTSSLLQYQLTSANSRGLSDARAWHDFCSTVLLQVKSGEAAPAELQQEQEKLAQFSSQLEGLQTNYSRVKDQAAALLQRIGSVAGTGSPSSTGSAAAGESPSRSGTTGSAGGIGAVQNAVYAGLKFSGLAMRIAQDVVTSVKDDANKILKVGRFCCKLAGLGGCIVTGLMQSMVSLLSHAVASCRQLGQARRKLALEPWTCFCNCTCAV